jgi:hypothetical protein
MKAPSFSGQIRSEGKDGWSPDTGEKGLMILLFLGQGVEMILLPHLSQRILDQRRILLSHHLLVVM